MFESYTFPSIDNVPTDVDCAICLNRVLVPGGVDGWPMLPAELPCGHFFHTTCIVEFDERGNARCPLCRRTFGEESTAQDRGQPQLLATPQVQGNTNGSGNGSGNLTSNHSSVNIDAINIHVGSPPTSSSSESATESVYEAGRSQPRGPYQPNVLRVISRAPEISPNPSSANQAPRSNEVQGPCRGEAPALEAGQGGLTQGLTGRYLTMYVLAQGDLAHAYYGLAQHDAASAHEYAERIRAAHANINNVRTSEDTAIVKPRKVVLHVDGIQIRDFPQPDPTIGSHGRRDVDHPVQANGQVLTLNHTVIFGEDNTIYGTANVICGSRNKLIGNCTYLQGRQNEMQGVWNLANDPGDSRPDARSMMDEVDSLCL